MPTSGKEINIKSSSILFNMKFDLHVHTHFSKDSNSDIDELIHIAESKGLDGFAVCDHDVITGGKIAVERAAKLNSSLIIIPGVEVSTSKGHLLVLDVKEPIPKGLTPEETVIRAKAQGAIVILPHPFKYSSHGIGYIKGLDVHCVEILNSRCLTNYANSRAKFQSQKLGYPGVGGSDCHEPAMIGASYTEIDANARTKEAVLEAIKLGNVSACGSLAPKKYVINQMFSNIKKKIHK